MFSTSLQWRIKYVGAGIVLALLFIYIIFRCLPPSVEEVDKCGVSVSLSQHVASANKAIGSIVGPSYRLVGVVFLFDGTIDHQR